MATISPTTAFQLVSGKTGENRRWESYYQGQQASAVHSCTAVDTCYEPSIMSEYQGDVALVGSHTSALATRQTLKMNATQTCLFPISTNDNQTYVPV